jgi:uncharacterized protein (TIGR01777 family)
MTMRVIITGGTGLIGKALANNLAGAGHEVIVLSRNKNKTSGLAEGVRVVEWDARSAAGWASLADGAGAIVNLAAANIAGEGFLPSRWTAARKKRILESRLNAGKAVVDAVRAATTKPDVVIQASAVGYYGTHGDEDITEDAPAGNDFLAGVVQQWEASTAQVETLGTRRCVIRTGLPLSTNGGALPRLMLPFQLFVGGPLGSGKQQMPWIHLDDVIAAIRYLIDTPKMQGVYNLSAPEPVTNAVFSKALGNALGRPCYFPTPGFAYKIAFGELSIVVLEGQRAVPSRLLAAGYAFQHRDLDAALRDLVENNK